VSARALLLAALLGAGLGACATVTPTVPLSSSWPSEPADYDAVTVAWTREGSMRAGYDEILRLSATFTAPAWRAAHVDRRIVNEKLPPASRPKLIEEHRKIWDDHYEVILLVTTWDRRENDLARGARSVWKLALIDDQGTEIEPSEIRRDKRPPNVIRAEFPKLEPFGTAYIARFPRRVDLLHPGAKRFSLRMSSPRGAVLLTWEAPRSGE
jgi:hypothetical protein